MKLKIALGFALCAVAITAHAEKIALVGATAINPADGKVMPNATVVINGDKIEHVSMGKQDAAALGKQIDCVGKFILPDTSTRTCTSFNQAICLRGRTAPI